MSRNSTKKRSSESPAPYTMSVRAAAAYSSISRTVLFRLIKAGKLEAIKLPGKLLIKRKDLERFLNAQEKREAFDLGKF